MMDSAIPSLPPMLVSSADFEKFTPDSVAESPIFEAVCGVLGSFIEVKNPVVRALHPEP